MNIIIVRDIRSKPLRFSLHARRVAAASAAAAAVLLLLAGGIGFLFGDALGPAAQRARAELAILQDELDDQRLAIAQLRSDNDLQLDALALRMGELQARSSRLEALGERLVVMGQLEDGEFRFGEPPALGGPAAGGSGGLERIDLDVELATLEGQLDRQARDLQLLERLIADRELDEALEPAGRPVNSGWLSSRYGRRIDPFSGEPDFHGGIDFSGRPGDDILAVADGVVVRSRKHGQYGYMIDIDHGTGYLTRYAHNSENLVSVGDRVRAGQVIAKMGSTGRATGTHVHFEVWFEGRRLDPMELVSKLRG